MFKNKKSIRGFETLGTQINNLQTLFTTRL